MGFGVRWMRRGCVPAVFFLVVALAPTGALRAEPTSASAPPAAFNPKLFTWPQPSITLDKFDTDRFLKTSPGMRPLDQIDFGGSQLRLDTSRYPTDLVPRAVDDASELGDVVVPRHRGQKQSRWRQYIGLTFTTPTH
jgi:hypothetical protein